MRLRSLAWVVVGLMLMSPCLESNAHKLAPTSLELDELRDGYYRVSLQRPQLVPSGVAEPKVVLPAHCSDALPSSTHLDMTPTGPAVYAVREVDCGEENLFGSSVAVRPLEGGSVAVVRVNFLGGRSLSAMLSTDNTELSIQEYRGLWSVVQTYMRLGVVHILFGFDHLLFVIGLLLLAMKPKTVLILITAFTLGHSVSLSLVALNSPLLPTTLVEVLILFTILHLAVELTRDPEQRGLLARHPVYMATGFGVIHGMGFAGSLLAIGLPVRDVLPGLVSFNVGVELGQIGVIALVLLCLWYLPKQAGEKLRAPSIYVMGTVSSYWLIDLVISGYLGTG